MAARFPEADLPMKPKGNLLRGDYTHIEERLRSERITFRTHTDIRSYVTLRIGGKVKISAHFREEKSIFPVWHDCVEVGLPMVFIGGGSNVAFVDGESNLLVGIICLEGIEALPENRIRVGAGVKNGLLLSWCQERGFGGVEFLAGIPGTVGGAAAVNAGAFGSCMADVLESARILFPDGIIRDVTPDHFKYTYRHSALKLSSTVILSLTLRGCEEKAETIARSIAKNQNYRKENHPAYSMATAGCFFKNPVIDGVKMSAGKILESCGVKGWKKGAIVFSEKHANFLVNLGNATFAELAAVEAEIADIVLRIRGIRLEREVVFVSSTGEKS